MTTGTANALNTGSGSYGQVLAAGGAGAAPSYTNSNAYGGAVLLGTFNASSSATVPCVSVISGTYVNYRIIASNIIAASSGNAFYMDFSVNNGSTYDTTAGHYAALYNYYPLVSSPSSGFTNATTSRVTVALSLSSSYPMSFVMDLMGPATPGPIYWNGQYYNNGASEFYFINGTAIYATGAWNAFRFLISSGNMTSGSFLVYGMTG